MFQQGGLKPFMIGSSATISRDIIFGGVFALLRHELRIEVDKNDPVPQDSKFGHKKRNKKYDFMINILAGCLATILSSPLNYVRNIHYATPPDAKVKSFRVILIELWKDSCAEPTRYLRVSFMLKRLRIGWGTARVGCGMAVGSYLYTLCSSSFV